MATIKRSPGSSCCAVQRAAAAAASAVSESAVATVLTSTKARRSAAATRNARLRTSRRSEAMREIAIRPETHPLGGGFGDRRADGQIEQQAVIAEAREELWDAIEILPDPARGTHQLAQVPSRHRPISQYADQGALVGSTRYELGEL